MAKRTCACGHSRGAPEIQEEPEYTLWGWIQLSMIGLTPKPDRIIFRCIMCRKSVGMSRDPALLKQRTQA